MHIPGWLRDVLFWTLFLLGLILAGNTLLYLNFDPTYGFLRLKQSAIASGWYLPGYYAHVLLGGIILVIGFLQHRGALRVKLPRLHRWLGYIYVFGILIFAAPGGFIMSFFIERGPLVLSSFMLQSGLWFYFTSRAFTSILRKNITAHEEWTNRTFALTLAAISLRVYIFIASFWFTLDQPGAYATLAWLSWIPNILIAEWLIRRRRRRRMTSYLFVNT